MPPLRTRPADRQGTACLEPRSLALQPSLSCVRQVQQKSVQGLVVRWGKEDLWEGVEGKGRSPFPPRDGLVQAAWVWSGGRLRCSRRSSMLR